MGAGKYVKAKLGVKPKTRAKNRSNQPQNSHQDIVNFIFHCVLIVSYL